MEVSQRELVLFYERQAARLVALAYSCTDEPAQTQLIAMASEYIEKLKTLPEGNRSAEPCPAAQ
jgi:hypothetical protein